MKKCFLSVVGLMMIFGTYAQSAENGKDKKTTEKKLFMDVHEFAPGTVTFDAVMEAHKKDLKTGPKYGVDFQKFWVDEEKGRIYCLATAKKAEDITRAHAKAHGLVPKDIYEVKSNKDEAIVEGKDFFLDFHNVGAGHVTADAVAGAHLKDLAVQNKYGVNLINYWLDEKNGVIFCLAQAKDSTALINTHKEAHGLVPNSVQKVKQGQ